MAPVFGLGLIVGSIIVSTGVMLWWLVRRWHKDSLDWQILTVRLSRPKDGENKNREPLADLASTEQLFNALGAMREPFSFEIAVETETESINFYLGVPRRQTEFAIKEVTSLFPAAQVEETTDYTIFHPGSIASAAELRLSESYVLPIRTYSEAKVDTFAPIIGSLSKLSAQTEGASLQLVCFPALDKAPKKAIVRSIENLKKGGKLSDILSANKIKVKDFTDTIKGSNQSGADPASRIVDDEAVKALSQKISRSLFWVNVRLLAAAPTKERSQTVLQSLVSAFSQFGSPLRNSFNVIVAKKPGPVVIDYIFRRYKPNKAILLNTEEMASVFHLPSEATDLPRVDWADVREAPPPENLPTDGVILGEAVFRGSKRPVRMSDNDRRRHLYIVGQTGTGKTGLIQNMAADDIRNGRGVCVVDPHGDLVDYLLGVIPPERAQDVIVFDPGDIERPIGLNMLEYQFDRPEQKTFIVNEFLAIFNRLFSKETMGPMFERYMRGCLLLLMEDANPAKGGEPATMMEIPRVFNDAEYRNRKLARITNPTVIDFWTKEVPKTTGDQSLGNFAPYITSKFDNFISNDYIRPIIGQTKSAFNFRQAMDEGKIILVNLSKGRIGDINANLLGMILVGRILMAALSRVEISDNDRRDFYLYIDEFQNFTTDSIGVILSEARKYRLNLTLAHQFIDQLTEEIRNSVFGNVGSMASFRVGPKDAEFLTKYFGPEFTERDLASAPFRRAFLRLLVDGQPSRPFNIATVDNQPTSAELRKDIRELSRLTYGQDLNKVEADILARLRL